MLKPAALTCLVLLAFSTVKAQQGIISGRVTDSSEKRNLQLAVVSLLKRSDTTLVSFTRTDQTGKFILPKADTGKYVLLVSYPRFADYMESLDIKGDASIGEVSMTQKSKLLDEVVIRTGLAIRIKGDTTEFAADSFKVKEGGTVEDLLKKLPGFSVNSKGEIVAQGKRVDKVLVDGEEFFGDDPTMATQNISAKAVDKVQIFETKTEQQKLTGITTGTEGKTVNIKLKEDAKKGLFGKVHVGTDFHDFFDSKALFNRFQGKKKISVYGTRSNINTGSLNWEDRQKLGIENDYQFDELSGYYFSFGGSDDFNDWNTRGLPDAYTAGALFSNKWNADKNNVNLSYRFNRLGTTNKGTKLEQYISNNGSTFSNKYTTRNALNEQHVINGKYEWKLDSLNTLRVVTVNTFKTSHTTGTERGEVIGDNGDTLNTSNRIYTNNTNRKQTDNQLFYVRLFKKKNRIWQTTFRYGITDDDNDGLNKTTIGRFDHGVYLHDSLIDQQKLFKGHSTTYGVKTTFSEPLSSKWSLFFDYAYNKNHSISERNTFEKGLDGKYGLFIPEFSSNFELDASSHSANAIFRYNYKKIQVALGNGVSAVKLDLQNLDTAARNVYHFLNITPQAQFRFSPKPQTGLSINYRGTTRQPTLNQLQPLRDNTDPLIEYIGNPDLKVGFNHSFSLNFNQYKVLKQVYSYAYISYSFQQNAISQYNTLDPTTGKRTYKPINVSGNSNWNFGGNWIKETTDKKLGYGFNLDGNGGNFVSFVDGEKAITKTYSLNLRLQFRKYVEEKFEIEFGPSLGYNHTNSGNNNYFTYGGFVDIDITLPWKLKINTSLNADLRQKIDAFSSNTNLMIWNARLVKTVFKKKNGFISLVGNDILDENKGFTRTINSRIVSDDRFQRVSRYFLLKFEWSFTKSPGGDNK